MNQDEKKLLDLKDIQVKLDRINEQITVKLALLKMADVATMLMLFIFMVGFYVADPFHLVTFISEGMSKNPAEMFTYFVLLAFAGIMAYTIAHLKREHYHHTARHNKNVWKVGFILVLFSMTGEIYNSLGSQQHSQFSKAESSSMFKSIVGTQISVQSGTGSEIATFAGKLANCKVLLAEKKVKDCNTSQARLDGAKESSAIAAEQAGKAATAASAQKTKDMMAVVEMNTHPFYKALAEMGIPQKIAALLLAAFVAYAFERMHLTLPEDLKDLYQKQATYESELLGAKKSALNANVTISEMDLGKPEITTRGKAFELPPEKQGMGFTAHHPQFKYQAGTEIIKEDSRPFMGFKDTQKQGKLEEGNFGEHTDRRMKSQRLSTADKVAVYTPRVLHGNTANTANTAGNETQGICPTCGNSFSITRWNKRFCSDKCKDAFHNTSKPERAKFEGRFKPRN